MDQYRESVDVLRTACDDEESEGSDGLLGFSLGGTIATELISKGNIAVGRTILDAAFTIRKGIMTYPFKLLFQCSIWCIKNGKMYAGHRDLPKGVSMHTDSFIFPAAAVYLAMKEVDSVMAYDVMKKVMAEKSAKTGQMIAKCCRIPGFRKFFLGMWGPLSHRLFGESAGFKNVFYPKEEGCFRMDIIQCPYHQYLTELGCAELNILFCENDVHAYGDLPGLKFTRTSTIGAGGDRCDFKMEIV